MAGAFSGSRAVEGQTLKNKSQKVGVFFRAEKLTAKTPRLPRKSPHPHQPKTTSKTRFLLKTPAKTTIHHEIKNILKSLAIRMDYFVQRSWNFLDGRLDVFGLGGLGEPGEVQVLLHSATGLLGIMRADSAVDLAMHL